MTQSDSFPNRLITESSPYLRQHALNPVDWYAWGPEALAKAKELAQRICNNAPLSNFAITNSLPRLQDMGYDDGLYFERMVGEYTRSPESITRLKQFLDKTAPRLRMPEEKK